VYVKIRFYEKCCVNVCLCVCVFVVVSRNNLSGS